MDQAPESQHTPGPWFVGSWHGQCHIKHVHNGRNCKYDYTLNADDDFWAAYVSAGSESNPIQIVGGTDDGPVLTVANARLIAAAPEMLAALQETVLQLQYLADKFGETGTGAAVLSRVEAVIAKATALTAGQERHEP